MENCLTHLVAVISGISRFRCATIASPQSLWSNLTFLSSGVRVGFWLTCAVSSTQTNVRKGFALGSPPAIFESCEPTCALGSKIGPMAPILWSRDISKFVCTDETSCHRERKELPPFIWKVMSLKETPTVSTSTSYPKWWLLRVWHFQFLFFHNRVYLGSKA